MSFLTLLALAVGLAADATAVAIASALGARSVRARDALLLATSFGLAQAAMPLIGSAVGSRFADEIEAWDHWVVLAVLGGLGAKMVYEAATHRTEAEVVEGSRANPFALKTLAVMAIATSIDALAAGLTLPLLGFHIAAAAAVIGAVTLILCFAGATFGQKLGASFGRRLDGLGGGILIALGIKTVIEHVAGG